MSYVVYKLTSPSNKVYIGITSQTVSKRWENGRGYRKCPAVFKSINKYGWDNFKKEILYKDLTEFEAKKLEIALIKIFKSNNKKFGYNLTEGGDGTLGRKLTEEQKKRISEKNKNKKLTEAQKEHLKQINLGKHHSEETKRKMSESRKGNKYNLGRKLSEERKRKISESQMGAKNQHAKRVICLETLKIYDTITQAKDETKATKITECCRHYPKHKSSNGLHWEFYDEELTFDDYKDILAWLLEGF